jgi:hypothetical protein
MSRAKQTLTLSCLPGQREALEALAANLGYCWGEQPNISAMIAAIADGTIKLKPKSRKRQA